MNYVIYLYNVEFNQLEFAGLNFNQILTGRQYNLISSKSNNFKVGINALWVTVIYNLNKQILINLNQT